MEQQAKTEQLIVHVVDDDPAILESLSWMFNSLDIPFMVYSSAQDFLCHHLPALAGCLILDVRMPGIGGIELQEYLAMNDVQIPVIFVSGHSDVPVAVRAMKHGAIEFLQKPFDQTALLEAIERAFAIERQRREAANSHSHLAARLNSLSPREREILQFLLNGESAKEIGKRLDISPRTVEFHRNNVLAKINARSLVSLAALVGSHLE